MVLKITFLTSLLLNIVYVNAENTDDGVVIFVSDYSNNSLVKLSVNDTHAEEIRRLTAIYPLDIAYNTVDEQLYWVERNPSSIKRADTNLQHVTTVLNVTRDPYHIAIDDVSRRLFYTDYNYDKIVSVTLQGFKSQTILEAPSVKDPLSITIHHNYRRIIWSDEKDGHKISSSNYDGSDIKRIVNTSGYSYGLALDENTDTLYWGQYDPPLIQAVSLNGSNIREIYRHHSASVLNIFLFQRTFYFTVVGQRLHRIPVDGGDAEEILSSPVFNHPYGLYIHSKTPYQEKPKVESRLIHTDSYHSELVFLCSFSQHSEDVFYSTSWFVDDNLVLSSDPEKWSNGSVIENQVLTETHLRESNITAYGIQISCSVEATFEEGNVSTPSLMSRKKFVGIRVSTTSVRVTQGASTDIKLSLTDPFGCGSLTNVDECRLRVKVNTLRKPDLCDQAVMMPSECGASFVASRWNESVSISLFGKVTSSYGSSSKEVNLNLTSSFNWAHQMWGEALLPLIQIQLTKDTSHIEAKSCYSSNDPHLKTFDGRRYEHQYDGNFTFYKHMDLPIEVQIQTARCSYSQNAWCNCGVAVRAGRTVFEINRCPGQSDIWFIDYTLCDDGGDVLQVKRRGSSYDIYLPTGGKVVVNAYGSFLNLQMYPSVQDTEKSAGLCGKMSENDACNDDFVLRDGSYSTDPTATDGCNAGYRVWVNVLTNFSVSWSVENGSNLFDHSDFSSLSSWPQQKTFCSCSTDKELNDPLQEVECSAGKAHETCKSIPGYSDVTPSKCSVNRRRRRSVREAEKAYFHHVHKRNANTWPGNWTEEKATEHCEQLFNESKSIQICQNITGSETNTSIDSCILDIKLTGTTDFGKYSVDSVRSKCYHEVVVNPVLQDNDTSSSGNQSVYDIVVAEACPSDCSSNGNCSEGTCYCLPNFGGLDCSVDLSAPPVLSSVQDDGHCDTSSLSCDFISVYGETFTEESTCLVKAFKVRGSGPELEWSRVSNASVQSICHVECDISVSKELEDTDYVRAYWISVSNDGTLYSNNVSVLVYDGRCVTGYINGTDISWTRQDSFCFYGEKCYMNGEARIDDDCKVCIVNGSSTSWENSTAPNCTDILHATTTDSTTEETTEPLAEATTRSIKEQKTGATIQTTIEATTQQTTEATAQSSTELTSQLTTESPLQQTTEAVTQSTTESTKEPTTQPTTEASTQPTTESTTQPTTESTTQPTTESTKEPTTQPTTESTTQPTTEASSQSITQTTTGGTTQPTTEASTQPTTEASSQSITQTTTGGSTQPTTEASTQPTTESTTKKPTQPTTESTTQPTTESTKEPTTQPTTESTTQTTTGGSTQPTTKPTTKQTESSSKSAIGSPTDGTTVLTTELPTEATTEDSSIWTTEDDTMTTEVPVSDRSKMDFNTVTALSVAGGIVAFAVLVAVVSFITIKVGKLNNQMKGSRLEKSVSADQGHSWRQNESLTPDHSSTLDDTKMPGRWSVGRKFITTSYKNRPQFGHI